MTRKRAEVLTGYEIRTLARPSGRFQLGAFVEDQLIAEATHWTEHLALKALVEAVYRLHCGKVLKQCGGRCVRCRLQSAHHIHHKRYRSHGGTHEVDNLEPVCWDCHRMIHEIEYSQ